MNADVIKFIEWIAIDDHWHFHKESKLWVQDGYGSKTTEQLFRYFLKYYYKPYNPQ